MEDQTVVEKITAGNLCSAEGDCDLVVEGRSLHIVLTACIDRIDFVHHVVPIGEFIEVIVTEGIRESDVDDLVILVDCPIAINIRNQEQFHGGDGIISEAEIVVVRDAVIKDVAADTGKDRGIVKEVLMDRRRHTQVHGDFIVRGTAENIIGGGSSGWIGLGDQISSGGQIVELITPAKRSDGETKFRSILRIAIAIRIGVNRDFDTIDTGVDIRRIPIAIHVIPDLATDEKHRGVVIEEIVSEAVVVCQRHGNDVVRKTAFRVGLTGRADRIGLNDEIGTVRKGRKSVTSEQIGAVGLDEKVDARIKVSVGVDVRVETYRDGGYRIVVCGEGIIVKRSVIINGPGNQMQILGCYGVKEIASGDIRGRDGYRDLIVIGADGIRRADRAARVGFHDGIVSVGQAVEEIIAGSVGVSDGQQDPICGVPIAVRVGVEFDHHRSQAGFRIREIAINIRIVAHLSGDAE